MIRSCIAIILAGLAAELASAQTVAVTPEETDAILANPGMGWQTFQRTRLQDRNLPDRLHLNDEGYQLWSQIIRRELDRVLPVP